MCFMSKSARFLAWHNLCIATINEGIKQAHFGVKPGEGLDSYSGDRTRHRCRYTFTLCGRQVHAVVYATVCDELLLEITVGADTPESTRFGDAEGFCTCWFERQKGAWLQTELQTEHGGSNFRCKTPLKLELAAIKVAPDGYAGAGRCM
jgi:hypothetical protein